MNSKIQGKRFFAAAFLSVLVIGSLFAQQQAGTPRRIGLFVGANVGSSDDDKLSFAESDAKSVSQIFSELGEINKEDNYFLEQPGSVLLDRRLDEIKSKLAAAKRNGQTTELIFYYAGHFDKDKEDLNLGTEDYPIAKLSDRIENIGADARIVIFDMCYAGGAARASNRVPTPTPTLSLFKGSSVLTSTKDDEKAWEWGSIQSTYFTHSLITGLRGAADVNGDSNVSFKELSEFVKKEVERKTINSKYPQAPQSKGPEVTGLTNIRRPSRARIIIDGDVTGRIRILDTSRNFIVSDLTKEHQRPMEMALDPGDYQFTFDREDLLGWAKRQLRRNQNIRLRMNDFVTAGSRDELRNRIASRGSEVPAFFLNESLSEYSSSPAAVSVRPVSIDEAIALATKEILGRIPGDSIMTIHISSELSKHPALSKIIKDKLKDKLKNEKKLVILDTSGEVVELLNELDKRQDYGDFSDDSQIPPGQIPSPNIIITVDVTQNFGNTYYLHVEALDRSGVSLHIVNPPLFYRPDRSSLQGFNFDLGGGYSWLVESGGTYESVKINLAVNKFFTPEAPKVGVGFYGTFSFPKRITENGQGTSVLLDRPEYDAWGFGLLIGPTIMLYKSEKFCLPVSAGVSYSYVQINQQLQNIIKEKHVIGLGTNITGEIHFHRLFYFYLRSQFDFGFYTEGTIEEKKLSGWGVSPNIVPGAGLGVKW